MRAVIFAACLLVPVGPNAFPSAGSQNDLFGTYRVNETTMARQESDRRNTDEPRRSRQDTRSVQSQSQDATRNRSRNQEPSRLRQPPARSQGTTQQLMGQSARVRAAGRADAGATAGATATPPVAIDMSLWLLRLPVTDAVAAADFRGHSVEAVENLVADFDENESVKSDSFHFSIANGAEITVDSGIRVPSINASAQGRGNSRSYSVNYQDTGTTIEIVPRMMENEILVGVQIRKSDLVDSGVKLTDDNDITLDSVVQLRLNSSLVCQPGKSEAILVNDSGQQWLVAVVANPRPSNLQPADNSRQREGSREGRPRGRRGQSENRRSDVRLPSATEEARDPSGNEGRFVTRTTGGPPRINYDKELGIMVISGTAEQVEKIKETLNLATDSAAKSVPMVERIQLQLELSSKVAEQIQLIYDEQFASQHGPAVVKPISYPNSLVVIGSGPAIQQIKQLASEIDKNDESPEAKETD